MSRYPLPLLAFLTCAPLLWAAAQPEGAVAAGQALAAELRALQPAKDFAVEGVLERRDAQGKRTRLDVRMVTRLTAPNAWMTSYEILGGTDRIQERLTVRRWTDRPNEYEWAAAGAPAAGAPGALQGDDAYVAFAGTDFFWSDLGLEFLHWPQHRLLPVKNAMRKGRSCRVLESVAGKESRAPYARVVSWVDRETGGLILAEAYDAANRLLKHFSVGSVTKVQGRWELKNMEIRNTADDTRTVLKFQYEDR
jgi:hypothetical protein